MRHGVIILPVRLLTITYEYVIFEMGFTDVIMIEFYDLRLVDTRPASLAICFMIISLRINVYCSTCGWVSLNFEISSIRLPARPVGPVLIPEKLSWKLILDIQTSWNLTSNSKHIYHTSVSRKGLSSLARYLPRTSSRGLFTRASSTEESMRDSLAELFREHLRGGHLQDHLRQGSYQEHRQQDDGREIVWDRWEAVSAARGRVCVRNHP